MKSILLSIKPKYVELIANGEKTIEVRKTKPTIETPFKCYIYCTKLKDKYHILGRRDYAGKFIRFDGKIIGEFICDRIEKHTTELNDGDCYEDIRLIWVDDDSEEDFEVITTNERDNSDNCTLLKDACLTFADLKKYLYKGKADIITFYAWHISNLKIYDKPKELSEFRKPCDCFLDCLKCKKGKISDLSCRGQKTTPPQSWCYVEVN